MRYIKPIVWLIFIFSGASGLIYEVIWMRQLTLIFGSTVFATSTVLTAFMAGLALGHYISSFLWHATCTKKLYSLRRLYWGTLSLLQHREP
jgi:predicted membrane-bound spermidine synthase